MGKKILARCHRECINGKEVEICIDEETGKVVSKKVVGEC